MYSADTLIERLSRMPITLMPESKSVSAADIRERFPDGRVVACDFYLTDAEKGERIAGGLRWMGIDNVDHHAPLATMRRHVSSANLALEYVEATGPIEGKHPVVIHHTDCDSVLSSAVVQGILLPDLRFGRAAIAADHTGEEDPIADLLQALEWRRDLELSLRSLGRLMSGESLPVEAAAALQTRLEERKTVQQAIQAGGFTSLGGVYFAVIDGNLDLALVPSHLPDALLVMVARPNPGGCYPWKHKIRLGLAAPPEVSILEIGIDEFDPNFGGRWNAGSNRRAGGCPLTAHEYAERLSGAIAGWRGGA